MISGLLGIGSAIVSGVSGWFTRKQELAAAVHKNKMRLAENEQEYNHEWEMASLEDKDKILRWMSFTMFSIPMVWAYFDPEGMANYFEILDKSMPEWYKQAYMGMTGGIWGISTLKNAVPSIVGQVKSALKGK